MFPKGLLIAGNEFVYLFRVCLQKQDSVHQALHGGKFHYRLRNPPVTSDLLDLLAIHIPIKSILPTVLGCWFTLR
jgi:hypothetical protein